MTTDERQYRAALWAYWCAAHNERNARKNVKSHSIAGPDRSVANDLMRRFCLEAQPYTHVDDEAALDDPEVPCAFSLARAAYSFRPSHAGEAEYPSGFGSGDSDGLRDGIKRAKTSAPLRDTFEAFIGTQVFGGIARTKIVSTVAFDPRQKEVLERLLNVSEAPATVDYFGAWLVGWKPGYGARYVFGCRRHVPAADAREGERLWAMFQYPEAIVGDYPCSDRLGWVAPYAARIEEQLASDRSLLARVCSDLQLCRKPEQLVIYDGVDSAADDDPVTLLEPPEAEGEIAAAVFRIEAATRKRPARPQAMDVLRAFGGLGPLKEWLANQRNQHCSLRDWEIKRLIEEAPAQGDKRTTWNPPHHPPWRELILCTSEDKKSAWKRVFDSAEHFAWQELTVVILTPKHIPALLEPVPWVWSKYFGSDRGFSVIRDDPAHLRAALLGEDARPDSELVPNDRLPDLVLGARCHIHGQRGSGRTAALYELAQQAPRNACTIVIQHGCNATDWELAVAILKSLQAERLMIVVDNADLIARELWNDILKLVRERKDSVLITSTTGVLPPHNEDFTTVPLEPLGAIGFLDEILTRVLGNEALLWASWEYEFLANAAVAGDLTLRDFVEGLGQPRPRREPRTAAMHTALERLSADEAIVTRLSTQLVAGTITPEDLADLEFGGDEMEARLAADLGTLVRMTEREAQCEEFSRSYDVLVAQHREDERRLMLTMSLLGLAVRYIPVRVLDTWFATLQMRITAAADHFDTVFRVLATKGIVRRAGSIVDLADPGWRAISEHLDPSFCEELIPALVPLKSDDVWWRRVLLGLGLFWLHAEQYDLARCCGRQHVRYGTTAPVEERLLALWLLWLTRKYQGRTDEYTGDVLNLLATRQDRIGFLTDVVLQFAPPHRFDQLARAFEHQVHPVAAMNSAVLGILAMLTPFGTGGTVVTKVLADVFRSPALRIEQVLEVAARLTSLGYRAEARRVLEAISLRTDAASCREALDGLAADVDAAPAEATGGADASPVQEQERSAEEKGDDAPLPRERLPVQEKTIPLGDIRLSDGLVVRRSWCAQPRMMTFELLDEHGRERASRTMLYRKTSPPPALTSEELPSEIVALAQSFRDWRKRHKRE